MKLIFLKYLNWVVLSSNLIICILGFTDNISYGNGLGDIAFIYGSFIIAALNIRFIFSSQINESNYSKIWFNRQIG
jgi:hypothetical protein